MLCGCVRFLLFRGCFSCCCLPPLLSVVLHRLLCVWPDAVPLLCGNVPNTTSTTHNEVNAGRVEAKVEVKAIPHAPRTMKTTHMQHEGYVYASCVWLPTS